MTPFVHVEHAAGTYGVFLVTLEDVLGRTSSTTVITDENVQKAVGLSGDAIAVKPGERSKSF
uniref:hypothetical protein n=1 Tax=Klebsiella pneumoniae TaxID=573 RepID=UPI00345A4AD9